MEKGYDIIIIGGGIIGGSIIYHLYKDGFTGKSLILEKRDALAQDSTSLSAGAFRNIWSTEVNMKLTSYSIEKFKHFKEEMGVAIGFEQIGYLFTYYKDNWQDIVDFKPVWDKNGINVELLTPDEIEKMVPGLKTGLNHLDKDILEMIEMQEIVGGLFGKDCGMFNPTSIATGYFQRAKEIAGDKLHLRLNNEVKRVLFNGKVKGIELTDGTKIEGEKILIAAGAYSRDLLKNSGIKDDENIPVFPVKRQLFVVSMPPMQGFDRIPFTIIDNGIYFRPEAENLLVGRADEDQPPGYDYNADKNYYLDIINTYMQARIPGTEYCRIQNMWGGLYAINKEDENAILGDYPGIENLYLAVGFSGHGCMESAGVGKSMSEFILKNRFETIPEVEQLMFTRFKEGKLVKETIVI